MSKMWTAADFISKAYKEGFFPFQYKGLNLKANIYYSKRSRHMNVELYIGKHQQIVCKCSGVSW